MDEERRKKLVRTLIWVFGIITVVSFGALAVISLLPAQ